MAALGLGLDAVGRGARADRRARVRLADGDPAHHAESFLRRTRQWLDRVVPQRAVAGAALPLVSRAAVALSEPARDTELHPGRLRARLLHFGADFRAGPGRHPVAAEGPALRRPRDGA